MEFCPAFRIMTQKKSFPSSWNPRLQSYLFVCTVIFSEYCCCCHQSWFPGLLCVAVVVMVGVMIVVIVVLVVLVIVVVVAVVVVVVVVVVSPGFQDCFVLLLLLWLVL